MKRKVIQIVIDPSEYLYALCDDGTIWLHDAKKWWPIENIPQSGTVSELKAQADQA